MDTNKIKKILKEFLEDQYLYRCANFSELEHAEIPIQFVGIYVLSWIKDSDEKSEEESEPLGFYEADTDNLVEEIINLIEKERKINDRERTV